jgi:hypothetical protein
MSDFFFFFISAGVKLISHLEALVPDGAVALLRRGVGREEVDFPGKVT